MYGNVHVVQYTYLVSPCPQWSQNMHYLMKDHLCYQEGDGWNIPLDLIYNNPVETHYNYAALHPETQLQKKSCQRNGMYTIIVK